MTPPKTDRWISSFGDVVAGDRIRWSETVFSSGSRPKPLGKRIVIADIIRDSYGEAAQQHTFSLVVVKSSGYDALKPGTATRRKGRVLHRNGCERMIWQDETARHAAVDEKHKRGDAARAIKTKRQEGYYGL